MRRPVFPPERFFHPSFNVLSVEAQLTFAKAWFIDYSGSPISRDMLFNQKIPTKRLDLAISELVNHGLLNDTDGILTINDVSFIPAGPMSNADRQRLYRQKHRNETVTKSNEIRNGKVTKSNAESNEKVTGNRYGGVTPDSSSSVRERGPVSAPAQLESNISTGLSSSSFVAKATQDSALHAQKAKKTPDTSWIEPLLEAVRPLKDRTFTALSADERYLVARYHCLKFGNCTKTEASNKARAAQVAAGLARFPRSKNFSEMTVGQYASLAKKVWESNGKTPFFNPWLIESAVEVRCA